VYDSIHRLIDKGLVFSVLSGIETFYSPVDPDKLMELISEKKLMLKNVLPELKEKHARKENNQEAYIYKGIEGFKHYMRDILKTGEDVYFIGGKLIWLDTQLKAFSEQYFKEAKRQGIKFQGVFDAEVKNKGQEALKNFPKPHRFLPSKYSTGSAIIIFGDYVVTYTGLKLKKMNKDITIFVMRDKHLADTYRSWARFIFDNCK